VFKPDPIHRGSKQKTVHEELATYLTHVLRPATADYLVINKFLRHSWFFFQVLIKSMKNLNHHLHYFTTGKQENDVNYRNNNRSDHKHK
jgi:hypothetical protein